jgi:hypothetical protein
MRLLKRLLRRERQNSTKGNTSGTRPLLDALEPRRLLSASISITPVVTEAKEGTGEVVEFDIVKTGDDAVYVKWETEHIDTDDYDGVTVYMSDPGELFPQGNYTRRVMISPADDYEVEDDERFKIKITPSSQYTITSGSAEGKIINDDASVHVVEAPTLTAGAVDNFVLETRDFDGNPFPNGEFRVYDYDGVYCWPQEWNDVVTDASGRATLPIMGVEAGAGWFRTIANGGLLQQHAAPVQNPNFQWQRTRAAVGGTVDLSVKITKVGGAPLQGSVNISDDPNDNDLSVVTSSAQIAPDGTVPFEVRGLQAGVENVKVSIVGANASSTQPIHVEVPRIVPTTDANLQQGQSKTLTVLVKTTDDNPVSGYVVRFGWADPNQNLATIEHGESAGMTLSNGTFNITIIANNLGNTGSTTLKWWDDYGGRADTAVYVAPA